MDFYLVQGWSAPRFARQFTAATWPVKPENIERRLKG
ncbi:hypothetical protein H098_16465 [Pseudomonas fluorescens FH5]|nr:hypothetical protein CF150_02271 [Pseudomonas sp. CF150]ETK40549.1 hypothetical protein H098_16465 [Pseudomonas fluorescens FH5]